MAVGPLLAQLGTSVHFRHVDDGGMNREVIWLRRAVVVVIIIISLPLYSLFASARRELQRVSRDSTRKEGIIILDCYLTPPASHTKEWATDADAGNRWTDARTTAAATAASVSLSRTDRLIGRAARIVLLQNCCPYKYSMHMSQN